MQIQTAERWTFQTNTHTDSSVLGLFDIYSTCWRQNMCTWKLDRTLQQICPSVRFCSAFMFDLIPFITCLSTHCCRVYLLYSGKPILLSLTMLPLLWALTEQSDAAAVCSQILQIVIILEQKQHELLVLWQWSTERKTDVMPAKFLRMVLRNAHQSLKHHRERKSPVDRITYSTGLITVWCFLTKGLMQSGWSLEI